ncbi:T9SS type A sorting domain-containing protein [Polaribacter aestuariivivens]|uniref:T9SS type A sorting domain-containing protein n=1 Tax=Polaribacter aestuariivivens TaxID=2304626 RepID=A0A5S3NFS7_9FLAO|nr:T9SS type A sorting domain-containing protein [Polaribacter aestuariivivens]TMM32476.1 T9SS type A sorting domain-containing protein [Polaribacter aestuariivivens]
MKKITFLLILLIAQTSISQTFNWETATDNGTNVTETLGGITATVTTSNNDAQLANGGGFDGSSGNVVFTQNSDNSASMTITFSTAVNVLSIFKFIADADGGGESNIVFTPTGGSNSIVTEGITQSAGEVVTLNWTNITVINITLSGGGTESFGIDDIVLGIAVTAPTVTTTAASSVVNTSATLAGNITADGGDAITDRGIVYSITSENANPTIGGANVIQDTNGTGTGVFSESITGLAAGTQYSFNAYAINGQGTSYGTVATFTTTGKGWLGINSNWADASNWSPNTIPILTDNLVIPNTTILPVINSGTNAVANDITIETSSSLTINTGGSLTIEGNLSQNGTFTINSDATSNGSFILKGTQSGVGNVDYHRFLTTSGISTQGWHLVASPVDGKNINDFFGDVATNGTKRGIAPYINTNAATFKWNYYLNTDTPGFFTNAKGYTLKKSIAGTLNFSGSVNTNNAGVSIQVDATGDQFNAIGNPYPSYINSGTFLDNVPGTRLTEKTIWLWDTEANGGVGEYITKNSATAYKVAPGQGFFVKALNTGNVTFTEAMQTHVGGDTFLKQEPRPEITLSITDGISVKNTEIFYIKNKTTGFDDGYDSSMFSGVANPFAVYTQLVTNSKGENLAIQTLPNVDYNSMIVPVGINASKGKEITFSLHANNFPDGLKIFIEDKENNTFTRIDESNSNYKITLNTTQNGIGRFYLHTTSAALSVDTSVNLNNVSVYKINSNTIRINGLYKEKAKISIFSILGKQVLSTSFKSSGINDVQLPNLSKGVYLVKLITEKGELTQKIILE